MARKALRMLITFPLSKFCTRRTSRLRKSAPCLTTASMIFTQDSPLQAQGRRDREESDRSEITFVVLSYRLIFSLLLELFRELISDSFHLCRMKHRRILVLIDRTLPMHPGDQTKDLEKPIICNTTSLRFNRLALLVCLVRNCFRPSSVLSPVKSIGVDFPLTNNLQTG